MAAASVACLFGLHRLRSIAPDPPSAAAVHDAAAAFLIKEQNNSRTKLYTDESPVCYSRSQFL